MTSLLTQVDKYGLAHHPALWTGSFFADNEAVRTAGPARLAAAI